jgi:hypothetical protein
MNDVAEKLVPVAKAIVAEKGSVDLLALFMPEDFPNDWDLVLSAKWASSRKASAIKYVAEKLTSSLKASDLRRIGRIVIVGNVAARLATQLRHRDDSVGVHEYGSFRLGDVFVERAFVIILKRARVRKVGKSLA